MPWYAKEIQEIYTFFGTTSHGLTTEQTTKNRELFGANIIATAKLKPFWKILLGQFSDFIIWLLIVAAGFSFALGETVDSIAIIVIVIINACIGAFQEQKAQNSLESLKKLSAPTARVRRNGELQIVLATAVVCGDIVSVEAGDYIPADMRLIEEHCCRIDESMLTGEPLPIDKDLAEIKGESLIPAEQMNMAFMGTIVTTGKAKGIVVQTGMKTQLGQITGLATSIVDEATPLEERMDILGKYIAYFCIAVSFLVVLVGYFSGFGDIVHTFMLGVSLSVAAIPEGLPAIITITLAIGVYRMAKKQALIRKLAAVETLGNVTIICSDKTGTLTLNQMCITNIITADQETYTVEGKGFAPEGDIKNEKTSASVKKNIPDFLHALLVCGVLCNDSALQAKEDGNWRIIGDPTEGALTVLGAKAGYTKETLLENYPIIQEFPFDADKKYMAIEVQTPDGKTELFVKGAPDVLFGQNSFLQERMLAQNAKGLRCLGLGHKMLQPGEKATRETMLQNLEMLGCVAMYDPPRIEVKQAIAEARDAGITTYMITGDHKVTAFAIGKELGIASSLDQVITGSDLENIDDAQLAAIITRYTIFARTTPQHKLRIVRALKAKNELVAMTGDGVNDAPALREAHIGIAMGMSGSDIARDAAEMVLADDNYATIVSAVKEGRSIFANIKKSIFFILSHNASNILIVLGSILLHIKNLVSPLQLLWINLVTDSLPALSFSAEPKEPDLMKKRAPTLTKVIFSGSDYWRLVWQGGILTLSAFAGYYIALYGFTRTSNDTSLLSLVAKTIMFTIMVCGQQIQALNCRSKTYSIFQIGFFTNKFLLGAITLAIVLQACIIYIPILNRLFGVTSLNLIEVVVVVGCSLFPLLVVEIVKAIGRWRNKKPA